MNPRLKEEVDQAIRSMNAARERVAELLQKLNEATSQTADLKTKLDAAIAAGNGVSNEELEELAKSLDGAQTALDAALEAGKTAQDTTTTAANDAANLGGSGVPGPVTEGATAPADGTTTPGAGEG